MMPTYSARATPIAAPTPMSLLRSWKVRKGNSQKLICISSNQGMKTACARPQMHLRQNVASMRSDNEEPEPDSDCCSALCSACIASNEAAIC